MIVDTSAILAILFEEDDANLYADALSGAEPCRMSAANLVEAAIVVDAKAGQQGSDAFDALIQSAGIIVEAVSEEQAHVARQAYTEFGKGRHPAGLNFGDCFAYALAKVTGESLLFKGQDFAKTDIASARQPS